jgi:hypothetical protein
MTPGEAKRLVEELSARHCVTAPKLIFKPKPLTTKEVTKTKWGKLVRVSVMKGAFVLNEGTGEYWIEFYGSPTRQIVIHEFKHYLEHLGIKYRRLK